MKKKTINAFTLVEMLIVIVIIGILIAALMPRMQAAQWRARDVSRKTALSQIQSAIVTSQWDKWKWPGMSGDEATHGIWIKSITWELTAAGMNSIPKDPLGNDVTWLWDNGALKASTYETGDYGYLVATRNWSKNGWFVLMAKTEVEWWSNWVFCTTGNIDKWAITGGTDIATLTLCQTIEKTASAGDCSANTDNCTYSSDDQLRYIVIY